MRTDHPACLIAFEGPEGAGKSTQLVRAAEALRAAGLTVHETFEPGATTLGRRLRDLLLHTVDVTPAPMAELFLYLADRAQHVAQVIRPAIEAGAVVLTDRFSASTVAYQGYGRGLDLDTVTRVDAWARGGLAPCRTILLDCPVQLGLARARGSDRFHGELEAFHERVRAGFLALAAASPDTWQVIDATQPADRVHELVMQAIHSGLRA